MAHNKKRAFTLVELLIVIVVIGILFVVVVSNVDFTPDAAKEAGVQSTFKSYQVACQTVGVQYGEFTSDVNTLVRYLNKRLDSDLMLFVDDGGNIQSSAVDPWGTQIRVSYTSPEETKGQLTFTSAGPDTIFDNKDDIITQIKCTLENDIVIENPVNTSTHTHSFSQQVTNDAFKKSNANCDNPALYYYSCSCGQKGTTTFPVGEKDPNVHEVIEDTFTPLADGKHLAKKTCQSCGTIIEEVEEEHDSTAGTTCPHCGAIVHTHNFDQQIQIDEFKLYDADCTRPLTYYYSCTCGEKGGLTFTVGTATDHNFAKETQTYLYTNATCQSPAKYYYVCTGCDLRGDDTFSYGMADSTNHIGNDVTTYQSLNSTQHDKIVKCSACGGQKSKTTEEHNPKNGSCSLCDNHNHVFNQEVIAYEHRKSAATCLSNAVYYKSCSCGETGTTDTFEDEVNGRDETNHTGHETAASTKNVCKWYSCCKKPIKPDHGVYQTSVTNAANCVDKGTTRYDCPDCEYYYTEENIPVTTAVHKAGCTIVSVGSSSVCKEYSLCHTPADTDHNMTNVGNADVCQRCSDCGYEITTHNYNQQNTNVKFRKSVANCDASAVYYKSCICGYFTTSNTTFSSGDKDSTNHIGGDVTTYQSLNSTQHNKIVKCNVCNGQKSKTAEEHSPKTGSCTLCDNHNHVWTETATAANKKSDANCQSAAVYYKSCSCGEKDSETFTSGSKNMNVHAAECSIIPASQENICTKYSLCGQTASSSHGVYTTSIVSAANCVDKGATRYDCPNCEYYYTREDIDVNTSNHKAGCTIVSVGSSSVCKEYSLCHTPADTIHNMANSGTVDIHQQCVDCGYKTTAHTCDQENTSLTYRKSAATCMDKAVYYRSCSCGYFIENDSNTFTSGNVNLDAHKTGCTITNAKDEFVCKKYSICGTIVDNSHNPGKNASCTEAQTCVDCGYTLATPIGHTANTDDNDCTTAIYCKNGCGTIMTSAKSHTYSDTCDTTCNNSGCTAGNRTITHTYSYTCDTTCNICGYVRSASHSAAADDNNCTTAIYCQHGCDTIMTNAKSHTYDDACDTTCNNSGCTAGNRTITHTYSYSCDTNCNVCGYVRVANHSASADDNNCTTAVYCQYGCGAIVTTAKTHTYDNACDTTCNNSGCTAGNRTITHTYSYTCDTNCNVCGNVRSASHSANADDNNCTTAIYCQYGCGEIMTNAKSHIYDNACDTTCNNSGCTAGNRSITHNYTVDSGVQYSAATCTDARKNYLKCSVCSYNPQSSSYVVSTGDALGHSWAYACSTTCSRNSSHTRSASHNMTNVGSASVHQKCSYSCGYQTTSHSYTVDSGVQYSAATCTTPRQNYKQCSCGYNPRSISYLISTGSVSSSAHSWGTWSRISDTQHRRTCNYNAAHTETADCRFTETKAATCTTTGTKVCNTCGQTVTIAINASNHTGTKTKQMKEPDKCIGWTCCGVVADSTHNYSYTCDTTCNDCGYVRSANHSANADDNNCTTAIYCQYGCGAIMTPAKSHTYDNACDTTCNNSGCTAGNRSITHNYTVDSGIQYSAATCTDAQKNYLKCSVCSYNPQSSSYVVSTGNALGHSWAYTCSTTCSRNSSHTRSASHNMTNVGSASVHQRCSYDCGYQTTSHSYTNKAQANLCKACTCGYQDTSHTATSGGTSSAHSKCSDCGYTISSTHSYTNKAQTNLCRTCTCGYQDTSHTAVNGGTSTVHSKCSDCGYTISSTHSYTNKAQTNLCRTCTCGYQDTSHSYLNLNEVPCYNYSECTDCMYMSTTHGAKHEAMEIVYRVVCPCGGEDYYWSCSDCSNDDYNYHACNGCPSCGITGNFYHDGYCPSCENTTMTFCNNCGTHFGCEACEYNGWENGQETLYCEYLGCCTDREWEYNGSYWGWSECSNSEFHIECIYCNEPTVYYWGGCTNCGENGFPTCNNCHMQLDFCQECGFEPNVEGFGCMHCGAYVTMYKEYCESCNTFEMYYCGECGAQNVCGNCGYYP